MKNRRWKKKVEIMRNKAEIKQELFNLQLYQILSDVNPYLAKSPNMRKIPPPYKLDARWGTMARNTLAKKG